MKMVIEYKCPKCGYIGTVETSFSNPYYSLRCENCSNVFAVKEFGNPEYGKGGYIPNDSVNHPSHYQGDIETIDYIKDKLTAEEFRGFCLGNTLKYTSRARLKNGDEDLRKARNYIDYLLEV